jgi:hypothetical protein
MYPGVILVFSGGLTWGYPGGTLGVSRGFPVGVPWGPHGVSPGGSQGCPPGCLRGGPLGGPPGCSLGPPGLDILGLDLLGVVYPGGSSRGYPGESLGVSLGWKTHSRPLKKPEARGGAEETQMKSLTKMKQISKRSSV